MSRVETLKSVMVPKLELSGAELLDRFMWEVTQLKVYNGKYFFWCDSALALFWIRRLLGFDNPGIDQNDGTAIFSYVFEAGRHPVTWYSPRRINS